MPGRRFLLPVLLFFIIVNSFAIVFRGRLLAWGFDREVLIIGNLLIFCLTLLSFWILYKGFRATTTPAFLRSVYGSFILKLLVVAGVMLTYVSLTKTSVNRPSIYACMFLYLIYTFIEVNLLMKLGKPKRNA
jgi:hypothetical protein